MYECAFREKVRHRLRKIRTAKAVLRNPCLPSRGAAANSAFGRGYPSHGIDVYCFVINTNGNFWRYVRDTTTGVAGWAADSAINQPLGTVSRELLAG